MDEVGVVVGGGAEAATTMGTKAGITRTVVVVVSKKDSSLFKDSKSVPWTTQYYTL